MGPPHELHGNKFFVFKIRCAKQFCQSIAEQIRIFTIVKSPFKFIQITVNMLVANFMIRASYRTFKKAPDIFNRIGMDVAANIFTGTIIRQRGQAWLIA